MRMVNGRPIPDTAGEIQSEQGLVAILALLTECAKLSSLNANGDIKTSAGVGAKNGATVSVVEYGIAYFHKTIISLTDTPITVVDGGENHQGVGGVKIYDLPAGAILTHGAIAALTFTAGAGGIADAFDGDFGIGTVVGTGDDLTTTMQNIIPKTTIPQAAAGVAAATGQSTAAESTVKDGTTTPVDVFLSALIDDADISADDTLTVSGTIIIHWTNLGDY
ncbi:conserved hypothetical protein [Gammaproteobacteria bacterium]